MSLSIKKNLILISFLLSVTLIAMSEKNAISEVYSPGLTLKTDKIDVEHHIILDLDSKTDKVIYDNLVFSSYYCTKLNPKQVRCSQEQEKQLISSHQKVDELYSYTSSDGQAMRVYQTKSGAAHLELQESDDSTLHRYTFTSVEKASVFASQNKNLFKTENFDWDISYLDYIL